MVVFCRYVIIGIVVVIRVIVVFVVIVIFVIVTCCVPQAEAASEAMA